MVQRIIASMKAIGVVVVVVMLAGAAHADPVNLLTHHASVINVGSTVANKAIKPEHLVDGKLDTAWNSATGDLVGARIIVRFPATVKVEAIKLTVGFTKIDKKLGDLFTKNPRIKKVRVTHDKLVVENELDIANRALQTIPITGGGGDYKIEVLAIEPGSKKDWRETCISELEVWGTADALAPHKPDVYVNSFYPPPLLADADCNQITGQAGSATVLSDQFAICEMSDEQADQPFNPIEHTITLISIPKRTALANPIAVSTQIYEGLGGATDSHLSTTTLDVGTDHLVVTARGSEPWTNLPDDDGSSLAKPSVAFGVYRATATGFEDVLQVEATDACVFAEGAKAQLDLTCGKRTTHYKRLGTNYVKR